MSIGVALTMTDPKQYGDRGYNVFVLRLLTGKGTLPAITREDVGEAVGSNYIVHVSSEVYPLLTFGDIFVFYWDNNASLVDGYIHSVLTDGLSDYNYIQQYYPGLIKYINGMRP